MLMTDDTVHCISKLLAIKPHALHRGEKIYSEVPFISLR